MSPRESDTTVLVVDVCEESRAALLEQTEGRGWSVITATNPEVAFSTFQMSLPDIVISDVFPPGMAGLALTRQVKRARPTCSVILMGKDGGQEAVLRALQAGAFDYLPKPVRAEQLSLCLDRALRAVPTAVAAAPGIERVEHVVVMAPDPAHVESTLSHLLCSEPQALVEPRQQHLRAALHELLLNAVEHGCLEIPFEVKHAALAGNAYDRLVATRRRNPRFRRRRVTIRAVYDTTARSIQYRIADDGRGFRWKPLLRGTPPASASPCGRGIFVARALCPDLTYNAKGNEAIVTVSLGE